MLVNWQNWKTASLSQAKLAPRVKLLLQNPTFLWKKVLDNSFQSFSASTKYPAVTCCTWPQGRSLSDPRWHKLDQALSGSRGLKAEDPQIPHAEHLLGLLLTLELSSFLILFLFFKSPSQNRVWHLKGGNEMPGAQVLGCVHQHCPVRGDAPPRHPLATFFNLQSTGVVLGLSKFAS